VCGRPPSSHLTSDVDVIFDRDRNAEQGQALSTVEAALGRRRLEASVVPHHGSERVELAIEEVDPLQVQVHQSRRSDLPGGKHPSLLRRPGESRREQVHPPP